MWSQIETSYEVQVSTIQKIPFFFHSQDTRPISKKLVRFYIKYKEKYGSVDRHWFCTFIDMLFFVLT